MQAIFYRNRRQLAILAVQRRPQQLLFDNFLQANRQFQVLLEVPLLLIEPDSRFQFVYTHSDAHVLPINPLLLYPPTPSEHNYFLQRGGKDGFRSEVVRVRQQGIRSFCETIRCIAKLLDCGTRVDHWIHITIVLIQLAFQVDSFCPVLLAFD